MLCLESCLIFLCVYSSFFVVTVKFTYNIINIQQSRLSCYQLKHIPKLYIFTPPFYCFPSIEFYCFPSIEFYCLIYSLFLLVYKYYQAKEKTGTILVFFFCLIKVYFWTEFLKISILSLYIWSLRVMFLTHLMLCLFLRRRFCYSHGR